jgi:putative aldouronate transport system substrate-binding protein
MKSKLKVTMIAVTLILVFPLFSYAGGGNQSTAQAGGALYKLTLMANFNEPEPPRDNSDLMLYLRNTIKADIQIEWYPTPVYMDTLGVKLSANDLPDSVVVRGSAKPENVVSAVRDGMFWELDKYLGNSAWPGLAKLSKDRLANIKIDGKVYALPIERELVQAGVLYRKDWLDKLGLAEPKNMDDVWNIIKIFSERNPDGIGREVTGMSMKGSNLSGKLGDVSVYYGGKMEWYWDAAARIVRHQTEDPAYQKSLDFHREAYAGKYFVQDLVELRDEYLPMHQGRAGLVFFSDINDVIDTQIKTAAVFPHAKIGFTQQLQGPDGSIVSRAHIGFNGGFFFPKTSVKTEARLEEVLKYFNALGSDDAILTMRRGIKDKHYSVQNGSLIATDAQIKAFREVDFPDASLITPFGVTRVIPERFSDPLLQATFDSMASYNGKRFLSISDVYISETAVKLGNTLTQTLTDARMKYVIGQINLAQFQAEVARWRAAGGDQVQKELTAAYIASPW